MDYVSHTSVDSGQNDSDLISLGVAHTYSVADNRERLTTIFKLRYYRGHDERVFHPYNDCRRKSVESSNNVPFEEPDRLFLFFFF